MYSLPEVAVIFGWIFNILMTVFIFRVWFQACLVPFNNPISRIILKLTSAPIKVLGNKNRNGINLSAIAIIIILLATKYIGIYTILDIPASDLVHPIYWTKPLFFILHYVGLIFFYVLIVGAILSWFGRNTLSEVTESLTAPIYSVLRRFIPPIGMIDVSIIVLLILLEVANYLIIKTLISFLSENVAFFLWTLVI